MPARGPVAGPVAVRLEAAQGPVPEPDRAAVRGPVLDSQVAARDPVRGLAVIVQATAIFPRPVVDPAQAPALAQAEVWQVAARDPERAHDPVAADDLVAGWLAVGGHRLVI